jgi:serine O-acetyltransferase
MFQQLIYLKQDIIRLIGKKRARILNIWLSRSFWGVLTYRFERGLFMTFGSGYRIIRFPLSPMYYLIQQYTNIEIHYASDIKGGIKILHPSAGVVISGLAVIGCNITLTGGNIIGVRSKCKHGDIQIGGGCTMGANAVILGPIKLGNDLRIGALACVVKDCLDDGATLIGVPAKKL